ncbi:hypothetical protein KP22_20835 [Pectobacterium betavasculorum]|uniref:Uncharacterized protein n=1 Tax=Pectobacterium betavasculorum TaxID=55207 RepID=A0A093S562_9GAMM|nr:hypothetical protein KP22_20835 [Pectobacterium betavasculorum]KFX10537.1 hypothetical protein JV35_21275 [Pectobacterium betavasculorum]
MNLANQNILLVNHVPKVVNEYAEPIDSYSSAHHWLCILAIYLIELLAEDLYYIPPAQTDQPN